MGIGAYPWYAPSGFCGVTAVFYCPTLGRYLSYGLSRPVETAKEAEKIVVQLWQDKSAWGIHTSMDSLAKSELSLTTAKLSDNDRLSSSESTKGEIINARTELTNSDLASIVYDDFTMLKELFATSDNAYAILKPTQIGEGDFDKVLQQYKLPIYDKNNTCITLTVPYTQVTHAAIEHCEEHVAQKKYPEAISVSMTIDLEHMDIQITPFAFWAKGGIINLGKDARPNEKKSKSYFSRFFKP